MKSTVIINVVGLTPALLNENTPFLNKWAEQGKIATISPILPAVTCSSQATYLTGKMPNEHGIVGNGWYYRDECEVKFWRQSNHLITTPKIWHAAKKLNPDFTCSNFFWWYNMYSDVDIAVTPRPMYLADGRKIPDCYTRPTQLRDQLQQELGQFPLFNFWGPTTSIKSTQWIANAAKFVHKQSPSTLSLIYLPHLDYNLQRLSPDHPDIVNDLLQIDKVCADLVTFFEKNDTQVIILSEYGIEPVDQCIPINRILRENNYITVRNELGHELLDPGVSRAFAVADHQIAHVYYNDKDSVNDIRALLENTPGIALVLDKEQQEKYQLNHFRSGDFVVVANNNAWFSYYYWLDDKHAPDFARTVDIHRKPGYDPVELFFNPEIKLLKLKLACKLLKKSLNFRTLFDVIPLQPDLVRGSHGAIPKFKKHGPLIISKNKTIITKENYRADEIHDLILRHLTG